MDASSTVYLRDSATSCDVAEKIQPTPRIDRLVARSRAIGFCEWQKGPTGNWSPGTGDCHMLEMHFRPSVCALSSKSQYLCYCPPISSRSCLLPSCRITLIGYGTKPDDG